DWPAAIEDTLGREEPGVHADDVNMPVAFTVFIRAVPSRKGYADRRQVSAGSLGATRQLPWHRAMLSLARIVQLEARAERRVRLPHRRAPQEHGVGPPKTVRHGKRAGPWG